MGNHTIDCEFCGEDQRLHGVNCCQEAKRADHIERENRAAERERLRAIIRQIDPSASFNPGLYMDSMYVKDVVKLIERAQQIAMGINP